MIGLTRAAVVAAAGAGLVVAAAHAPTLDLAPARAASAARPTLSAVASTAVVCPGPETLGVDGVAAGRQSTSVVATTVPGSLLPDAATRGGAGALTTRSLPAGVATPSTGTRGSVLSLTVTTPRSVLVTGSDSLAAGAVGAQATLTTKGDARGLSEAPCVEAGEQAWLVAGGGEPGRQERLVLANPGPNPVQVDLTVLGTAGPIVAPGSRGVVVAPYGRTVVLLDALAGSEKSPVVGVTATGGDVAAVLSDSWLDGIVPRGGDDAVPAAPPARELVVPGVAVSGRAMLRLAVPGPSEAVVRLRLLTAAGPQPLPAGGVVRVPAGSSADVALPSLPAGAYAVQVGADVPVLAGASVERRTTPTGPSDLAWTAASTPVRGLAGAALLPGVGTSEVQLVATDRPAVVTLSTVSPSGEVSNDTVAVPADTVVTRAVTGAASAWLKPVSGSVRAAVVTTVADAAGPMVSTSPLASLPLTTTPTTVREARD